MANEIFHNMRTRNSKNLYTSFWPKFSSACEEQQFIDQLENSAQSKEIEVNDKANTTIHYTVSNDYFVSVWDKWGWAIKTTHPAIG